MGHLDNDFVPPYAVTMWRGEHDIFVALPMVGGGIPYIMRFPLSEGGLSQAMEVLNKRKHEVLTPTEAQVLYEPPNHQPQVKLGKRQQQLNSETTPEQRKKAAELFAKLGLKR